MTEDCICLLSLARHCIRVSELPTSCSRRGYCVHSHLALRVSFSADHSPTRHHDVTVEWNLLSRSTVADALLS